uniref:Uncharacterized protein n=1 Tax=Arundo donax TaxID=35708 RepID=A0A0A9GD88_ARUDO
MLCKQRVRLQRLTLKATRKRTNPIRDCRIESLCYVHHLLLILLSITHHWLQLHGTVCHLSEPTSIQWVSSGPSSSFGRISSEVAADCSALQVETDEAAFLN